MQPSNNKNNKQNKKKNVQGRQKCAIKVENNYDLMSAHCRTEQNKQFQQHSKITEGNSITHTKKDKHQYGRKSKNWERMHACQDMSSHEEAEMTNSDKHDQKGHEEEEER